MPIVEIPERGDSFHEMWRELMRLTKEQPAPWTLIGAHMVALHGWARGREQIRPSRDADILVNARLASKGITTMSQTLVRDGYQLIERTVEGHGHAFGKGDVSFDVLAPDGMGARARMVTVDNFRTVAVPGGTQALDRTAPVEARTRKSTGIVFVPNLLGAILVKVRAIEVDDDPQAQRSDVAFLLSLVDNPDELARQCSPAERRWLRRHPHFGNPRDRCWNGIVSAEDGAIVYRRLTA